MTGALLAGLLAGYGIAMPVGAVATYLVTLTARTSARVGAAGALGVASADGLYALIAVIGGAALTGVIARIAGPLRWVSAVVLIVLAVRIAWTADPRPPLRRARRVGGSSTTTAGRAYASLLGITLLNPVTVLYFSALVLGSQANGLGGAAESAVFVIAAFCRIGELAIGAGGRRRRARPGAHRADRATGDGAGVQRRDHRADRRCCCSVPDGTLSA